MRKIKQIIALALLAVMLFSLPAAAREEKISAYQYAVYISVNGTYMDEVSYLVGDTLYVPLRAVNEGFGYQIIWNDDRSIDLTATILQDPVLKKMEYQAPPVPKACSFVAYMDELTIRVNGVAFETPHFLFRDRTYVPLSFFRNVMNCHVYEGTSNGVVKIYSPDYVTFGENDAFYYDGQMLTKEQYQDARTFIMHAIGGNAMSSEIAEQELTYLKAGAILGDKIVGDKNFQSFYETNKMDAFLDTLNLSDRDLVKNTLLKYIFYQYEINDENAMAYYSPSEEELSAQLASTPYKNGHWMKAKHILIPKTQDDSGLKKAEELLKKLQKNPSDFDKLMAEHSQDPGSNAYPDGYLFREGDMVTEFYEGALPLKKGELSEIVESQYGYHIILKVADYENGVPYTEIRDELHLAYAQAQFRKDLQIAFANVNTVLNRDSLEK
ncbi:MAG: peptidylprolyl isomerase [Clostridia bacterium]|nr:peptidylprolyl isomerase [Clostridia bacterium]